MQRNRAIVLPVTSLRTSATHTWVLRPVWTALATHEIVPVRAVPRKFAFNSAVVKVAPSGNNARHLTPHAVSARAITDAA